MKNAIEPHWDATNDISVRLGLKLGHTNPESYRCYHWRKK
ncbi:MAG: GNAT family N-acetyltransferase [Promethearchaeota archaeon]